MSERCNCGHDRACHLMRNGACRLGGCLCVEYFPVVNPFVREEYLQTLASERAMEAEELTLP